MQVSARVAFSVRRTTDTSDVTKKELTTPAILPMTLQLAQCSSDSYKNYTHAVELPCVHMRVISIGSLVYTRSSQAGCFIEKCILQEFCT